MAAIRELVTLFTFKIDQAGLNKYEVAMSNLKNTAKSLAGAFGIALGLEKIYEFASGLMEAGKEINKTIYQIQRLARDQDDLTNIGDTLLDSALKLHVAYTDVADTFKEMLRESESLKLSTGDVVTVVENLYKTFRVGRLNEGQSKEVLAYLNQQFRRGGLMTARAVNTLADMSTETMNLLRDYFGKDGKRATMEEMEQLAKDEQLTTDKVVTALSKRNARLDADFAKAPVRLSQALTDIYSRLTQVAAKLFKMLDNSVIMAKGITWAFNKIVDSIKAFVAMLGGAERAIRLVGIAIGVVISYKLITWIYAAIKGMNLLSIATLRAMAVWIALAAAVAILAIELEDIYVWMTGGDSDIGQKLGSFEDFKKKVVQVFEDIKQQVIKVFEDIQKSVVDFWNSSVWTAPLRAIVDLINGDFASAWENLKASFTNEGLFVTLLLGIASVKAAFLLWDALKFGALLASLSGLVTKTAEVGGAVNAVTAAFNQLDALPLSGLLNKLGLVGKTLNILLNVMNLTGDASVLNDPAKWPKESPLWRNYPPELQKGLPNAPLNNPPGASSAPADKTWDWMKGIGSRFWYGPDNIRKESEKPRLEIVPQSVSPGAIAPPGALAPASVGPTTNTQQNEMNVTNNINVTTTPQDAAIAAEVRNQVSSYSGNAIAQMARQLAGSAPRTEAKAA